MYCPNCGTANEGAVRFCANCGTPLDAAAASPPVQTPFQQQPTVVPPYAPNAAPETRGGFLRFLGIGCLVVLAIFILFGLGCARSCLFGRRRYMRFGRRVF
jgi:zinc-ribbon domain